MRKKLISGYMFGLVLGLATAATAATVVGNGYLHGWTVTVTLDSGDTITCSDPYVWTGTRELECNAD